METTEDCSPSVVVIWGIGGIGKTTLAQAVVSKIDRSHYNYARIKLDEVSEKNKNKYTEMQEQILKDAFPKYMGGRKIELRDSGDGKDKLREAFTSEGNKAVFLYIDNALYKEDLEELLPKDLGCLPQHSRILITTRTLAIADMLEEYGFRDRIKDYSVKTLSDNDAVQILREDRAIRDRIKDDLEKIVIVCKGVPLVLKIVGANLRKQKYDVNRCTRIIEDLKAGKEIKDLSDRLFHFVYKELDEATQEAFLDICCYFENSESRRIVEYIVGADEVKFLQDAALITPELFGQLTTLTHLNLSCCESLKELPDTFGQLTTLTYLYLWCCESLKELPDTFGQLEALEHLNLFSCSSLDELPRGIEQLRSLKYLNIHYCAKLESDICQEDGSIKIVERSLHLCSSCHRDKKLEVVGSRADGNNGN